MAIDFDAAALAHQVTFQQRCAGHLRQPGCHRAIVARALLATPAVEVEVDQAQPALAVAAPRGTRCCRGRSDPAPAATAPGGTAR
ncbi:hypothetical protein G6F63_016371 [Rhizopus arrhizus]|nr:hypothetical protein G6F63_016371 [Rhizopus arrhizus]